MIQKYVRFQEKEERLQEQLKFWWVNKTGITFSPLLGGAGKSTFLEGGFFIMGIAVARAVAASSDPAKIRPWIQDFNLGATYDAVMIRAQIQATYDSGLNSWMSWDPKNIYTMGGYLPD